MMIFFKEIELLYMKNKLDIGRLWEDFLLETSKSVLLSETKLDIM